MSASTSTSRAAKGGKIILVLGGGGMKGMAHIGAYKAIEEAGLRPAEIVGCSMGGLVGALIASGRRWDEIVPVALAVTRDDVVAVNRRALLPLGLRAPSIWDGTRLQALIRREVKAQRFDEMSPPLTVVAVDFQSGAPVYFGTGEHRRVPLHDAVYASSALPVFFPPIKIQGRYYIDGGVADPLPIDRAAEHGADLVIAVDVGSAGQDFGGLKPEQGIAAMHQRAAAIATAHLTIRTLRAWSGSPPLVYIRPHVEGYSGFEFGSTAYFIEEGYRAARRALANAEAIDRFREATTG